ncbi:MAG: hypothetical protein OQK09_00350 [Colwellia sp.]|nr:hypothetical protein [Colwellia sp.]MCW8863503.1 hypothetical protein [Colwellia sp.]MCW9079937.1 hypothetical protein [Colwellia sp.]
MLKYFGCLFFILTSFVLQATEQPQVRGALMHLTHYDPWWLTMTDDEKKFDLKVGLALVDAMAEAGFNTLILDIEDGVIYQSHPKLTRAYSIKMSALKELIAKARGYGMEVIPKLNLSSSNRNQHDRWLSPYWDGLSVAKTVTLSRPVVKNVFEELINEIGNLKYFHIGMDEDHNRSTKQYVAEIKRYHTLLKSHGIKTVIWSDGAYLERDKSHAQVYAEKTMRAAPDLPKDIIQMIWDYDHPNGKIAKELSNMGFTVWAAPGNKQSNIDNWKKELTEQGLTKHLVLTPWTPTNEKYRQDWLKQITKYGKAFKHN